MITLTSLELKEAKAAAIAADPKRLRQRLLDARYVLNAPYRVRFRRFTVNLELKQMRSADRGLLLQWLLRDNPYQEETTDNQQTNVGAVHLYRVNPELDDQIIFNTIHYECHNHTLHSAPNQPSPFPISWRA